MKKMSFALVFFMLVSFVTVTRASAEFEIIDDEKVSEIIQKQDEILQALAEIKAELEVVKIRASQR